jgi:hypothetical protein
MSTWLILDSDLIARPQCLVAELALDGLHAFAAIHVEIPTIILKLELKKPPAAQSPISTNFVQNHLRAAMVFRGHFGLVGVILGVY